MPYLTFDQAQQVHRHIAEDDIDGGAVVYPYLRYWAADRLLSDGWPEGEGMGSSDVSIALTEALRTFEAPHIGPVIKAYTACGFTVPATVAYPDAFADLA